MLKELRSHPYAKTLQTVELEIVRLYHEAPVGVSFEHVMHPHYWSKTSQHMKVGVRIEVKAADGSWWAMLIVSDAPPALRVQTLQFVELEAASTEIKGHPEYEVKPNGSTFAVMYKPDDIILRAGLKNINAAHEWFTERCSIAKAEGKEPYDNVTP